MPDAAVDENGLQNGKTSNKQERLTEDRINGSGGNLRQSGKALI